MAFIHDVCFSDECIAIRVKVSLVLNGSLFLLLNRKEHIIQDIVI